MKRLTTFDLAKDKDNGREPGNRIYEMNDPITYATPGRSVILALSLPLAGLLILSSTVGLLHPEIYSVATDNWLTQTVGQDAIDLFVIVPVLIVGALYSYYNNPFALAMWAGTNTYLTYTFLIYCFAVGFNSLFIVYCVILGLASYSTMWFVFKQIRSNIVLSLTPIIRKTVGIYFIVIAILFYFLWLLEIIPATISGKPPASLQATGLLTNPVHVLDISIFLPLILVCGWMLLRNSTLAIILAPLILIFFILMNITIGVLAVVMLNRGFAGSMAFPAAMGLMAVFSLVMVIVLTRATEQVVIEGS